MEDPVREAAAKRVGQQEFVAKQKVGKTPYVSRQRPAKPRLAS